MKEQELNNKVSQILNEFESMEGIQPSSDWDASLLKKLNYSKHNKFISSPLINIAAVVVVVVIINAGFLVNLLSKPTNESITRKDELQIVSKELLINPTSIND